MRKGVEINNFIIKLVYQAVTNTATGDVTYEMYFFYDSYNHLTAIRYVAGATDHYYYVTTNVQGDVLGIYTAAGVLLASYEYDAWGNCTVTTHNANYTIGDLNPIRYRGYYYDTETGFYYCNSRYYDPEIGRWISPDNVVAGVGQSVQGYNLYTYCFNNPVNMDDPDGNWPKSIKDAIKSFGSIVTQVKAVLKISSTLLKIVATSTTSVASGAATLKDVWNDVKNYDFFNTDESKVLNSKVFSSYKGTPVLKHDISGITSFSISNTIVLNKNETVRNGGVDTIKHEWGHTVQQSLVGTQKFMDRIAIPSVISCIANPSSKIYYSLPWERTADFFGGVYRSTGYYAGSDVVAGLYLILP